VISVKDRQRGRLVGPPEDRRPDPCRGGRTPAHIAPSRRLAADRPRRLLGPPSSRCASRSRRPPGATGSAVIFASVIMVQCPVCLSPVAATAARCATRYPRRSSPPATAIAAAASEEAARPPRPTPIPLRTRFGSSPARANSASGSRTAAARNGSAERAARRSSHATPATPIRSAFAWAPSTRTLASVSAPASSSGTQRHGSRSPTTGYRDIRRAATRPIADSRPRPCPVAVCDGRRLLSSAAAPARAIRRPDSKPNPSCRRRVKTGVLLIERGLTGDAALGGDDRQPSPDHGHIG
jgi:hypothetical protein